MASPPELYLKRFSLTERALHWVHAAAFFVLLGSGLVLYLPRLSELVSRRPLVKAVHIYTALAWLIALVFVVAVGDRRGVSRTLSELDSFDGDDRRWLAGRHTPQGRFNAGQKINFWLTAAFAVLFAVSGFLLWYGERDTRLRFASTILLHDGLMYVSLVLLVGHLYLAVIHPTTRHALRGMTLGTVSAEWASEHHSKWVEGSAADFACRRECAPRRDCYYAVVVRSLKRIGWRGVVAAGVLLIAVATAVAAPRLGGTRAHARIANAPAPPSTTSVQARFAYLRTQHTNRCGMPASALSAMAPSARLQGSCCFPMNYAAYIKQRHDIRRYADVSVVPQDPYDISVVLARRLTSYGSINLTPTQQRVYDRAKPLSETKGPCCCPCWRWTAFAGQAKYLITRRHYTARQIANVWSVEEGCGGPRRS